MSSKARTSWELMINPPRSTKPATRLPSLRAPCIASRGTQLQREIPGWLRLSFTLAARKTFSLQQTIEFVVCQSPAFLKKGRLLSQGFYCSSPPHNGLEDVELLRGFEYWCGKLSDLQSSGSNVFCRRFSPV